MSTLSLLPTATAVAQSTTFTFPILTILGGPGLKREDWFKLRPHREQGQLVGAYLFLPAGMSASRQLDEIESAIKELRRHIGVDGNLLPPGTPIPDGSRPPSLALVPQQPRDGAQ